MRPRNANRTVRIAAGLGLAATMLAMLPSCTPQTPPPVIDSASQLEIGTIASTLDALHQAEAHFTQTGSFGTGSGTLWLDRPGRLRIDYAGPASSVMIANGGRLLVLDRATHATTTMPVSRTPLAILLAPRITLSGDVTVAGLAHDGGQTQITLRKTAAPAQGGLVLTLSGQPLALTGVTAIDAHGRDLTMTFSALVTTPRITPGLFDPPSS